MSGLPDAIRLSSNVELSTPIFSAMWSDLPNRPPCLGRRLWSYRLRSNSFFNWVFYSGAANLASEILTFSLRASFIQHNVLYAE